MRPLDLSDAEGDDAHGFSGLDGLLDRWATAVIEHHHHQRFLKQHLRTALLVLFAKGRTGGCGLG